MAVVHVHVATQEVLIFCPNRTVEQQGGSPGRPVVYVSVKLQAYSFALRVPIIAVWLPWLMSPLLFAALAGWLERKLKRDTFVAPRPPLFNTAAHAVIALWFFFMLWLASPIPLAVAAIPALATLLAFSVSLAIAHFPS